MNIHHYHPVTGVYCGSSSADPDPLELLNAQRAAREPIEDAARAVHAIATEEAMALLTAAVQGAQQTLMTGAATLDAGAGDYEAALQALVAERDTALADAGFDYRAATEAADAVLTAAMEEAEAAAAAVQPVVWLVPGSATLIEPPVPGEGMQAFFTGQSWELSEIPVGTPVEE